MAITLPVTIPSTATDALQPVDEFLMRDWTQIKNILLHRLNRAEAELVEALKQLSE